MEYRIEAIADRISIESIRLRRSRASLLEEAGLSTGYIDNIKKGKQPGAVSLARIADALGVSVDYLLGRAPSAASAAPAAPTDSGERIAAALERIAAALERIAAALERRD